MPSDLHPLADPGPHGDRPTDSGGGYNGQPYNTQHYPSTPYHLHPDFNPSAHPPDLPPSTSARPFASRRSGSSSQGSIPPLRLPSNHAFQRISSTTLIDPAEQHLFPASFSQPGTPTNFGHSQMAPQHHVYFSSPIQSPTIKNENYQHSSIQSYPETGFYTPNSYNHSYTPNSPVHLSRSSIEPVIPLNRANPNSPPVKKLEAFPAPLKPPRKRLSNSRFALLAITGFLLIGAAIGIICYAHQRHVKKTGSNSVSGDDGDVIAQSGLGSARNGTGTDDADPFGGGPPDEPTGADNGQHYDSLIVFGASYCDNAHARPAMYQASLKPKPYFKGRWTDGYVWNEYLAQMIGPGGGRTMLVNYAYGSATVDNSLSSANVPDFQEQVQAFASDLNAHSPGAGPYNGKTLLAAWVGINSITKIWNQVLKAEVKAQSKMEAHNSVLSAKASINASVDEIFTVMANLSQSTTFTGPPPDIMLLSLPPGSLLPVNIRAAKGNVKSLQTLADLSDMFNSRFTSRYTEFQTQVLPGQRVFTYDIPGLWQDFMNNPVNYGLSVVDQPCLSHDGICQRPNEYLYWDTLHPTTFIHHKLAILLRDTLRS